MATLSDRRVRPVIIAGLIVAQLCAPAVVRAQALTPVTDAGRCNGERIAAISYRPVRRDVVDRRLGAAGDWLEARLRDLQPQTRSHVVARYLQFQVGETCTEATRTESERILRAQPFIADAVIRAVPAEDGSVRLEVETIDELSLVIETFGWKGIPAGARLGTRNLGGTAQALLVDPEIARGGEWGIGGIYTHHQPFGQTLSLDLRASNRQLNHSWSVGVSRPFLSNFQAMSWSASASYDRYYYTFREPSIRDVSLEFERHRWLIGGMRRLGDYPSRANLGLVATGERSEPVRTVRIRQDGPEPADAPELFTRFPAFAATRIGLAAGMRSLRFVSVRGVNALSGPEDPPIGLDLFALALRSVSVGDQTPWDWIGITSLAGGAGSQRSLFRVFANAEFRFPSTTGLSSQFVGSGRIAWFGGLLPAQRTMLSLEATGLRGIRVPGQITFRDDIGGMLGYRSSDLGGARRLVLRSEHRTRLPSFSNRAELGASVMFERGKLWAGDIPFGTTTPWKHGAGVALLVAVPRGARQTFRFEFGWPVGDRDRRTGEFRVTYNDFTRTFWLEPTLSILAREAVNAARAVGAP